LNLLPSPSSSSSSSSNQRQRQLDAIVLTSWRLPVIGRSVGKTRRINLPAWNARQQTGWRWERLSLAPDRLACTHARHRTCWFISSEVTCCCCRPASHTRVT